MGLILHDKHSTSDKAAIRLAARIALKGGTIEGNSGYYANWVPYCDDPKPVVLRSSPRSDLKTVEAGLSLPQVRKVSSFPPYALAATHLQ